jgi:hypothetical protein
MTDVTKSLHDTARFLERVASQGGPLSGNAMEHARCVWEFMRSETTQTNAAPRTGCGTRGSSATQSPDGASVAAPDDKHDAAPQEGAGPPAGPAANGEPAVAALFANELERLPTTVSGSGVALVFFALHPEKRDELVRAIRSLEDAHYRAWHLEAEVNGIREAARAPSAELRGEVAIVELRNMVLGAGDPGWQVTLKIGNQSFYVNDAHDVKEEAEWTADMLRKAIARLMPSHGGASPDDMAMLIRQLVHKVKNLSPDSSLADRAMDYLKRHGLEGGPLRSTDRGVKP